MLVHAFDGAKRHRDAIVEAVRKAMSDAAPPDGQLVEPKRILEYLGIERFERDSRRLVETGRERLAAGDQPGAYRNLYRAAALHAGERVNRAERARPDEAGLAWRVVKRERNGVLAARMIALLEGPGWWQFCGLMLGLTIALRILIPSASVLVMPGYVGFAGLGLLMLLDLSVNYTLPLRFLAVHQLEAIQLSSIVMLVVAMALRIKPLRVWMAGVIEHPRRMSSILVFMLGIVVLAVAARAMSANSAVSGELAKLGILFAGCYLLAARIRYWAGRDLLVKLAGGAESIAHRLRFFVQNAGMAVVPGVVFAALLVAVRDFGQLAVAGGVIVVCAVLLLGLRWGVVSVALGAAAAYAVVSHVPHVRARWEAFMDPFEGGGPSSDLATALFFQEAALKAGGWGFGRVFYGGFHPGGLPQQVASDYTATMLVGLLGPGAWLLLAAYVLFLVLLMAIALRRLGDAAPGLRTFYAIFAFVGAAMLLSQAALTVGGNTGALPLTGIPLPLVSFGAWSFASATAVVAAAYGVSGMCRACEGNSNAN
jgi:cell division protein FtsW